MTKTVVKWWHKMKFWQQFASVLSPFAVGGEVAVYFGNGNPVWHWVIGGSFVASTVIAKLIKDENKDGIADVFQKDETP